jgi:hypothetical protein
MSDAIKTTFWNLLKSNPARRIVIPPVQRDYAQGRLDATATHIRRELVNSMVSALKAGSSKPMQLGLIFGSETEGVITLYDGQQRLTTLYLLHWYLAWRTKVSNAHDVLGRFTYETRLFARDFCHGLVFDGLSVSVEGANAESEDLLKNAFMDQAWFCSAWMTDPSVQGMIVMLNEIHQAFQNDSELAEASALIWYHLTEQPRIEFTWLLMHQMGLDHQLYVRLNGRGRSLTDFEKLKAWLDGRDELKEVWTEERRRKLDTEWSDAFWNASRSSPRDMGDSMMAFFLGVALNEVLARKSETKDLPANITAKIHNGNTTTREEWTVLFTPKTVEVISGLLECLTDPQKRIDVDTWSEEGTLFLFSDPFKDAFTNGSNWCDVVLAGWGKCEYTERLLFFGFTRYVTEVPPDGLGWNAENYVRWMRVVRNLAVNTTLNAQTLAPALNGILNLADGQRHDVDAWLSNHEIPAKKLDSHQCREEKRKAEIRIRFPAANQSLQHAEDQGFLRGQIGFLIEPKLSAGTAFDACWLNLQRERIDEYFKDGKDAVALRMIQKALLAQGDYLLHFGSKYGFANDREEWRMIFNKTDQAKKVYLHNLLLAWENESLEQIIDEGRKAIPWTDWRRWFIEWPHALGFCKQSRIEWSEEGHVVVLVEQLRTSSPTAELRTYCLYQEHLKTSSAMWSYGYGLTRNSHAFLENDKLRLELRHRGLLPPEAPFELRLLSRDYSPRSDPWISPSKDSPSMLSDAEIKDGYKEVFHQFLPVEPDITAQKAEAIRAALFDSPMHSSTIPTNPTAEA